MFLRVLLLAIAITTWLSAFDGDEAFYTERYRQLAASACQETISELYYSDDLKSPAQVALERVQDHYADQALLRYFANAAAGRDRWNILVIMLARQRNGRLSVPSDEVVRLCEQGLASPDEWLRTESAFGLGLIGGVEQVPLLQPLRADQCASVAEEADTAIALINDRAGGPIQ